MFKLKPCPFCGNERIGITYSRQMGITSGDDGWKAECQCNKCHATMTFWALKKTWAEETLIKAWNRRTADVMPVVHAKWELVEQEFVEWHPMVISKYACTSCGELVNDFHNLPRYCPWCGAKTKGIKFD